MVIDKKILDIVDRRKFTSFWECFDYLILASYDEIEALMASLEIFEGNIWNDVISAAKKKFGKDEMIFATGVTYNFVSSGSTTIHNWVEPDGDLITINDISGSDDDYDDDGDLIPCSHYNNGVRTDIEDILVHIYVMTGKANKHYKELYKSYIETRMYEEVKELEDHFKLITLNLKTELAIKLFNDGYSKYK